MTISVEMPDIVRQSMDATWNRARWERLPDDGNRYEIIDGVLYMSTAPSTFHQWIIRQIVRMLFRQCDDLGIGTTFWSPLGLFMPGYDPVQPDVLFVRQAALGIFQESRIYGVPALLIEVLSPGNAKKDTEIKRGAYARAGLPEYWLVRPKTRDVLVCSQPDVTLGDYAQTTLVAPDGELISPTLPLHTTITEFFAGAPDTTL